MRILVAVTIAAGLAACGEIPQDAPKPYAGKEDTKAYAGVFVLVVRASWIEKK